MYSDIQKLMPGVAAAKRLDNFSWMQQLGASFKSYDIAYRMMGLGTNHTLAAMQNITPRFYEHRKMHNAYSSLIGMSKIFPGMYPVHDIYKNEQLRRIHAHQANISRAFYNIGKISAIDSKLYQLNSLGSVFNALTSNAALRYAAVEDPKDAEDLNVIEKITERMADVTNEIYDKGFVTNDDLANIENDILCYLRSISKQDWQFVISLVISVLMGLLSFYFQTANTKQELPNNVATHEDLEAFRGEILAHYGSIKEHGIKKKINTDLNVRAQPSINGNFICVAPKGIIVTVLNIDADWAYITYVDSSENMPVCGWISTKFFQKKTFSKSFNMRRGKAN